jgi:integrase
MKYRHGRQTHPTTGVDRRLVAELLASGLEPATAKARQQAVRRFSAWIQLLGIKPPKLSEKLIRLMAETGMRAGEVLVLEMSDVNTSAGIVGIRKTNSGRGRLVSFSARAAVALDSLAGCAPRSRLDEVMAGGVRI